MTRKRKRGGVKGSKSAPTSSVSLAAPATAWDLGASGPANRSGLVIEPAGEINPTTGKIENPNNVIRARRVDMLEFWHRRGVISDRGYDVGVALRSAIEATQRAPGWPDNDRVQSSPKPDHAVTIQVDRLSKLALISGLLHPDDRDLVWHCVTGGIPATLRVRGSRPYHGARTVAATPLRPGTYRHIIPLAEPSRSSSAGSVPVMGVSLPKPPWGEGFEREGVKA